MLFNRPYGYDGEKSFTGESLSLDEFNTRYPDADFEMLLKDTLDITQHSRGGYGKGRMTRSLELCVYGIREI